MNPTEKDRVQTIRGRFLQALADGMNNADATAYANGRKVAPAKTDGRIPDDISGLPYPKLMTVAKAVAGYEGGDRDEAIRAIEAAKDGQSKVEMPKPEAPAQSPAAAPKDGQIEIPDDWRDAKYFTQRALAEKLSGTRPENKGEAVAMIEAEIAKRAA